ncbi:MAG TPA: FAD-binding oxidoreductase [Streptosporangiaceae bacterium]|nr:FAD-binding oxidoreductase [Streptosporangiaceae bacterium]
MNEEVVPAQLAKACADVTVARPADAVGGRLARYVAAPSSTQETAALLTAAAELGLTVVPRGSGSRIDWGCPPESCDLVVDTRRLDAVLEHAAGDMVARVQAGITLDALQHRLAEQGQRLALDPQGGGTAGGLVATGVAGPLRLRYGAPRDLLIGITVVRADGTVARAGGKVVKNVAGYDLGKLFAGSYGTLGLITEATFRLHPQPSATAYRSLDCADADAAAAAVQAAAGSPLAPSAVELYWPSAASAVSVTVLLEGDDAGVAERAGRLDDLLAGPGAASTGPASTGDGLAGHGRPSWWGFAGEPDQTVLRIGFWPGRLAEVLTAVRTAAAEARLDPAVAGAAAGGVLHVVLEHHVSVQAAEKFVAALRAGLTRPGTDMPEASAVVLHAPSKVRDAVDMWGPVPSAGLMRAIKDQFDPEHRMAPGRFAGGI